MRPARSLIRWVLRIRRPERKVDHLVQCRGVKGCCVAHPVPLCLYGVCRVVVVRLNVSLCAIFLLLLGCHIADYTSECCFFVLHFSLQDLFTARSEGFKPHGQRHSAW